MLGLPPFPSASSDATDVHSYRLQPPSTSLCQPFPAPPPPSSSVVHVHALESWSRTMPNETVRSISTIRRLQVTACSERFSPPPKVSRFRGSPKNGRRARAFP